MSPREALRAPKTQKAAFAKTLKNNWFFNVFANAGFLFFEALDGPLGRIFAPLEPIWSQNRSPNYSKSTLKSLKIGPLQVRNN